MPRVLQAAFSKKAPKAAPEIPDFDAFMKQQSLGEKRTIYDEASEENTFRSDLWWVKKDVAVEPVDEKAYGGEDALDHKLDFGSTQDKQSRLRVFLDDDEYELNEDELSDYLESLDQA